MDPLNWPLLFRKLIDSGMARGLTPAMLAECTIDQVIIMAAPIESLSSNGRVQKMGLDEAVRAGAIRRSPDGLSKAGRMRKAMLDRKAGKKLSREERRKRREAVRNRG